jgi:hypothetical protein
MAWSHFTKPSSNKPWKVTRSTHPDVGIGDILEFLGSGISADSKMTNPKGNWENAAYLGGSGTDTEPDVVRLFCKGTEHFIQRSSDKLACHSGKADLSMPFTNREKQGGKGHPTGTNPVWEAQEGG